MRRLPGQNGAFCAGYIGPSARLLVETESAIWPHDRPDSTSLSAMYSAPGGGAAGARKRELGRPVLPADAPYTRRQITAGLRSNATRRTARERKRPQLLARPPADGPHQRPEALA
jgi:hypothetical protein